MMFFAARRGVGLSLSLLVVSLLAAAALPGCNNKSGEARPDELDQASKIPNKKSVAKVAGHVSIDGQPPEKNGVLFVVLSDPQHLERTGRTGSPKLLAKCDPEGHFAFTTYVTGDGVPEGKYVVTFVQLRSARAAAQRRGGMGRPGAQQSYIDPDALNNLYNDPEKNKNDPTLQVDVAAPGKTDYEFNLSVAGKDPVKTPGEYAVTHITQ